VGIEMLVGIELLVGIQFLEGLNCWWKLKPCRTLFGQERDQLSYKPGRVCTTDISKRGIGPPQAATGIGIFAVGYASEPPVW